MELNTDKLIVHRDKVVYGYTEEHDGEWHAYVLGSPSTVDFFFGNECFGEHYVDRDILEAGSHASAFDALQAARRKAQEIMMLEHAEV